MIRVLGCRRRINAALGSNIEEIATNTCSAVLAGSDSQYCAVRKTARSGELREI